MSATIMERDMLKTQVPERDMSVVTTLRAPGCRLARPEHDAPWTAVWAGERTRLVWIHFWPGPVTPGGLGEAHASVVACVQAGEVPALDEQLPSRWLERLRARQREEAEPNEQVAASAE